MNYSEVLDRLYLAAARKTNLTHPTPLRIHLLANSSTHNCQGHITESICAELLRHAKSDSDVQSLIRILIGMLTTAECGFTPSSFQMSQVHGYCESNGYTQDCLAMLDAAFQRSRPEPAPVFCDSLFVDRLRDQIVLSLCYLIQDGYVSFESLISTDSVQILLALHESITEWSICLDNDQYIKSSVLDVSNPPLGCVRATARIDPTEGEIVRIASDPLLKAIVDSYLGASSSLRSAAMWHSFPSRRLMASSEAAQQFHFDLDTHRWLKVFIYLTNVGAGNGPHVYVRGTHVPGAKHHLQLQKRYQRISDEEITMYYPGRTCWLYGGSGTLIIGDTRAFHKGEALTTGTRTVLELMYSVSTFALKMM